MSAKLTTKEEKRIREILNDAAIEVIDTINEAIETAYQDGYNAGQSERE